MGRIPLFPLIKDIIGEKCLNEHSPKVEFRGDISGYIWEKGSISETDGDCRKINVKFGAKKPSEDD